MGPSWLLWAASPTLIGSSAWGAPTPSDLATAFDLWDALWSRLRAPLVVVTDVSRLEVVEPATYQGLAAFVKARLERMQALETRQLVLVAPDDREIARALGVGFLPAIGARHDFELTSDVAAGAAWARDASAAAVLEEASRRTDDAARTTPLLRGLRVEIDRDVVSPDLHRIAATLGTSGRTLQRRLAEAGTSFRDEVTAARCRRGARLIRAGNDKIASIASRVGFLSASHFSRAFRRELGVTPEEYRRG